MSINYYRVRTFPDKIDRFQESMSSNIIGIGWKEIGDVKNDSVEQIHEKLKNHAEIVGNNRAIGLTTGFFKRMLAMKPKDILIVPYNKDILFLEVIGTYEYIPDLEDLNMAHTIKISKIKKESIIEVSPKLKRAIDTPLTIISLEKYKEEIQDILR